MTLLTKPVFEKLISHMLYIEESADILADFYFPGSSESREDLLQFFRYYIKKIEDEIEQIKTVGISEKAADPKQLNKFPFVIIGSEVALESPSGNNSFVYKVIEPDGKGLIKNGISYLSDFGRELLLKEEGSVISHKEENGQKCLTITGIRLFT